MSTNIKVNGIYDVVTMKYFLEQGIFNVSFDLRPKSLNFIQTYLIASLLEQTEMSRCYLHFCDEKKFVIDKILEDLSSVIGRHSLYLEFSGHQDVNNVNPSIMESPSVGVGFFELRTNNTQ